MQKWRLLPRELARAYLAQETYPRNMIRRTVSTFSNALQSYVTRLDSVENYLFETDARNAAVYIRDLKTDDGAGKGQGSCRKIIESD